MADVRVILAGTSLSLPVNLRAELMSVGLGVTVCESAVDVINELKQNGAHVIVTAAQLKELSGYQLCCLLKADENTDAIPIVLVDESDGEHQLLSGLPELTDIVSKTEDARVLTKLINKLILSANKKGWSGAPLSSFIPGFDQFKAAPFNNVQSFLLDTLLVEKFVSTKVRFLLDKTTPHNSFLQLYFNCLKSFANFDFTGLVVGTLKGPWAAFAGKDGLSRGVFEEVLRTIQTRLSLTEPLSVQTNISFEENQGIHLQDLRIVPVLSKSNGTGLLVFGTYSANKMTANEELVIASLTVNTRALLEILIAQQEIEKLQSQQSYFASVDPLTGLYNLEFFIGFLQQQLLFSFRNKLAVAVLLIDVDRFASINSAHGNEMGDALLQKVANRILAATRASDLLARYGGDEFGIVLPNTDLNGARILADKLRLEIEQMNGDEGIGAQTSLITVSVGCAQFDMVDLNPETILRDAKLALQRAKQSGRNRVEAAV
jgi:diguanylate cyclase (GGDEF)-like protein